jgi:hypothetical protein
MYRKDPSVDFSKIKTYAWVRAQKAKRNGAPGKNE